mmetsp:Transcript_3218/g.11658  ORF Transcript_3218/g.11658 Transcript_3218/m.11658 type:complete len:594 (-) Transcript_3218:346-2127(-)
MEFRTSPACCGCRLARMPAGYRGLARFVALLALLPTAAVASDSTNAGPEPNPFLRLSNASTVKFPSEPSTCAMLVYRHVPKTGGTEFSHFMRDVIRSSYGKWMPAGTIARTPTGKIKEMVASETWNLLVTEILRDPDDFVKRYPFVYAIHHTPTQGRFQERTLTQIERLRVLYEAMGCRFLYFSIFREPLSLQISSNNFHFHSGKIGGKRPPWNGVVGFSSSDQSIRFLSGISEVNRDLLESHKIATQWGIHTPIDVVMVERALIDYERMDFVGFTHMWADSIYAALMLVGDFENAEKSYGVHHTSSKCNTEFCSRLEDLTEEDKATLKELAVQDQKLYEYALAKFLPVLQAARAIPAQKQAPQVEKHPVIMRNNALGWGCQLSKRANRTTPLSIKSLFFVHNLPLCIGKDEPEDGSTAFAESEGDHLYSHYELALDIQIPLVLSYFHLPPGLPHELKALYSMANKDLIHPSIAAQCNSFISALEREFPQELEKGDLGSLQKVLAELNYYTSTLSCGDVKINSVFDGLSLDRCEDALCSTVEPKCLRWVDEAGCITAPHGSGSAKIPLDLVLDSNELQLHPCPKPVECSDLCP